MKCTSLKFRELLHNSELQLKGSILGQCFKVVSVTVPTVTDSAVSDCTDIADIAVNDCTSSTSDPVAVLTRPVLIHRPILTLLSADSQNADSGAGSKLLTEAL